MVNDIVATNIIRVTKKFKQFIFRSFMIDCTIIANSSNIMDFSIFQPNFNIYYGIM